MTFRFALTTLSLVVALGSAGCESAASASSRMTAKKTVATAPLEVEPSALSDAELQAQITAYLGTIDTPITVEQWRSVGPRGAEFLQTTVTSKALPTRRARAIDGLASMQWAAAAPLVQKVANAEDEVAAVRFAAVRAPSAVMPAASRRRPPRHLGQRERRSGASRGRRHAERPNGGVRRSQGSPGEPVESQGAFDRAVQKCGTR